MRAAALLTVLVLLAGGAIASPAELATRLAREESRKGVVVSLCFAPVCGNGEAVTLDADRLLPPASVQKIVTTAAALDLLGPDHTFETRVRSDHPIHGSILEGNLYLEGDGDPFLVSERMWLLAQDLAAAGLRKVEGAIYVDAGRVTDLDSIRTAERTDSPYAAPVSRVGVNFNNLCFLIRPGSGAGTPAVAISDPFPIEGVVVANEVRTGPAEPLQLSRTASAGGERWVIRGCVATTSPAQRIYRAAEDPARLAGSVLRGLLGASGVEVHGVAAGKAPERAPVVASLSSLPLGALLRSMNGYSNNFMADLLLADLGNGRARDGAARVRGWLREAVGLKSLPTICDGSGLAAADRISASQITAILAWAAGREGVFADLYASLPRPHGAGTLEKRFRDGETPAVRAKTGTLGDRGVSSIAGYVDTAAGERYAFCIIQQASPDAGLRVADLRTREESWILTFVAP
jgi:serine-type D-Ala-D-Ala carboxypeptidase/endopeptidase (penicillin-binding protein 4)